jgi:acyl carrier protein
MREKLLENVAEILEIAPSKLEWNINFKSMEFNFNSLRGYAILIMIEEEFGVEMTVEQFIEAQTLSDLLGYIEPQREKQ